MGEVSVSVKYVSMFIRFVLPVFCYRGEGISRKKNNSILSVKISACFPGNGMALANCPWRMFSFVIKLKSTKLFFFHV